MATITTVVASVRATVHRPSAGPLTDAAIVDRANSVYPTLRRRLADLIPDLFTRTTSDIAVVDGTPTFDVTASPISLTDFGKLRTVEVKSGDAWIPLLWAPVMAPSRTTGVAGTYRVKYETKAATLVLASNTAIDLPDGMELPLIEELSAWVRTKFNESPAPHIQAAEDAWRKGLVSLSRQAGAAPVGVVDVRGLGWGPKFRLSGPTTVEIVVC